MKISQALSSTLLVAITDAIQQAEIDDFGDFKFGDEWEQKTLDALGEEFSKALSRALDGSSLRSFLRDCFQTTLADHGIKMPADKTKLIDIECFSDPLNAARAVVQRLEQIPIEYRLVTRVLGEFAERLDANDTELKLSDRLRLLSGAKLPASFKTKHPNAAIDRLIRRFVKQDSLKIDDKALYLEYRASGYLSNQRESRVVGDFYDEVRAFYGACMAFNILATYTWPSSNAIAPYMIGNSIIDDDEALAYVERAEEDVRRCANLSTRASVDTKIDEGSLAPDLLKRVLKVFSAGNAQKLKTACAWSLRANLSSRELDKILESAITIEVLMGDRDTGDRVGLTKLMANRCAYALGKSSKERDEMIEFFVQFYRVRSDVVHSGRTTLQANERKIVDQGLALATRILKHEISLAS
jgi:hypothetical protein